MTLIASLSFEGLPILVGDLLITENGKHWNPPTPIPSLVGEYIPNGNFSIAGLDRKLVLIGERCAIGWTCKDVKTATEVIEKLRSLEKSQNLNVRSIEATIEGHPRSDDDFLSLIILLATETGIHHYSYEISGPDDGHFKDFSIVRAGGSGGNRFIELLGKLDGKEFQLIPLGNQSPEPFTPNLLASAKFYTLCANLLGTLTASEHREANDAKSLAKRFGGGYELVYWDGQKFSFLSNYSIQSWHATLQDKSLHLNSMPSLVSNIQYSNEYLIIEATAITKDASKLSADTIRFIIAPHGGSSQPSHISAEKSRIEFQAHSIHVHAESIDHIGTLVEIVGKNEMPRSQLANIDGKLGFTVNPSLIQDLLRVTRESMSTVEATPDASS